MKVRRPYVTDDLGRHWPLGSAVPPPHATTLVAEEQGKIVGLAWCADAGDPALVLLTLSAKPSAFVPLWAGVVRMAKARGCRTVFAHVPAGGDLETALERRGAIIVRETSVAAAYVVDNKGEADGEP